MATVARFAICLLLACAPWSTARAQCVVRSSGDLSRVRVDVEGGEPIELVALGATEAEIRPLEGERARVRVLPLPPLRTHLFAPTPMPAPSPQKLVIASRESKLAMVQSEMIRDRLAALHPE